MSPAEVHSNYFAHVSPVAYLFLPMNWLLWPIAGYYPQILEPYMSDDAFEILLTFRVSVYICILVLLLNY